MRGTQPGADPFHVPHPLIGVAEGSAGTTCSVFEFLRRRGCGIANRSQSQGMMIRTRAIALTACLAALHSMAAHGQSQPQAPQTCEATLSSPTRDSVLLRVTMTVHAFDRERDLPTAVQLDFGDAMLAHLALPRPLGLDAYAVSGNAGSTQTAHLALRGSYAAVLTADGHVMNVQSTGGARNVAFDTAVLAALGSVDTTDMRSLASAGLPKVNIPIRVEITTRDSMTSSGSVMLSPVIVAAFSAVGTRPLTIPTGPPGRAPLFAAEPPDSEAGMPLFSFRVPVRAVTKALSVIPGNSLRYPERRRQPGMMGQAWVAFVSDAEGRPDPESIQLLNATHRDFAETALDAMSRFAYRPLEVNGCAVRALAEQPFQFYVAQ